MQTENTDVMCFEGGLWATEKHWTKRDAFILMDCDKEEYTDTPQRAATFILLKKSAHSVGLIDEWLEYMQDSRIVTDMPNQLGKENYEGFRENRHDQTAWSLLTKKHGIKAFRIPSSDDNQSKQNYGDGVIDRSPYPRIVCLHRRKLDRVQFIALIPQIISIMKRIENDKNLFPKKFQYGVPQEVKESLADLIAMYIEKTINSELPYDLPDDMPHPQIVLDSCRDLALPETPSIKEALSKWSTFLKKEADKNFLTYYTLALSKDPSLEDALLKSVTYQDLPTTLLTSM